MHKYFYISLQLDSFEKSLQIISINISNMLVFSAYIKGYHKLKLVFNETAELALAIVYGAICHSLFSNHYFVYAKFSRKSTLQLGRLYN